MMWGRDREIKILNDDYKKSRSTLLVLYGRRRVGKSSLVQSFAKDKPHLFFEGLENLQTDEQIKHFKAQLIEQIDDPFLKDMQFKTWNDAFNYLTHQIEKRSKKKVVLFFDELQWMAASQSRMISLIKFFWDNKWKSLNVQLFLCGSIASFMIEKVVKSNALYGRIDLQLHLKELSPLASKKFLSKGRSNEELLKYLIVFGGIPKYFELISSKKSFEQNIQELAFTETGYLFHEYEKIFYGQFKSHEIYEKIVRLLSHGPKTLEEISITLKMKSSGGLKRYLSNLEAASFIRSYTPIQKHKTKVIKYLLFDEYLLFYFKYIEPNKKIIQSSRSDRFFKNKIVPHWQPWLGLAFERFALKFNKGLCTSLGISPDDIEDIGPYFERADNEGFQIDLIIKQENKTWTICECKYYEKQVGQEVIKQFDQKMALIKVPPSVSIEKVLITVNGAKKSVHDSEYFDSILELKQLLY